MLPLSFYFSATHGGSDSDSTIAPSKHPILLDLRKVPKKRPVGRPRKLATGTGNPSASKAMKLVDYSSSSESEPNTQQSSGARSSKRIHRMYSKGQKSAVSLYARHHGIRTASRRYGVHHKNVQRWMKSEVSKIKNPNKRSNRKGQGQKISYPQEIEDKLLAWVMEKREAQFVAVSTQLIRMKARSLIKEYNPNFKASEGWVRKFLSRNKLVLRMQTHISQSLPKDLEDKIKEFRETVKKIREKSDYPLEFICNMDETPLYLDCIPRKVIDRKGKKTIHVRTTGSQKNRITVTLCCSASGKILPPFVVFKGKTMRPLKM